jgi:hypothetical protein
MVSDIETGLQQHGKVLPRITSFFSLRESEPEIERLVTEMDKVIPASSSPIPRLI